jgi:Mg2+/Co2+ transporter CorB
MNILLSLLIIFVFSGLAAILSASETAITMASRQKIYQLAKKKDPRAGILVRLQANMNTLISTVVLLNTCLFSGIASLATQMMGTILGKWGVFFASLFVGAFITFYLEVLPKVYAYQFPEKVGLGLAHVINGLKRALHPVTHFMDFVAHKTLRAFGIQPPAQTTAIEELRGAIDMHTEAEGAFQERAMLRSILDLSQVTVEEIMVHRKRILSFNTQTPLEDLYSKILAAPYTRVPLWRDSPDNVVGVVNLKTLARTLTRADGKGLETPLGDVMAEPWFIPATSTLFAQLQLFRQRRIHQAFVVDEYGSLLGMVTLEDILEEIVGEIGDEHDPVLPGVRIDRNGAYIVQGSVPLRDLYRQYDWDFQEHEASTLAGLILNRMRDIPEVGVVVTIDGFCMKILRRQQHQITLIEVSPPNQPKDSSRPGGGGLSQAGAIPSSLATSCAVEGLLPSAPDAVSHEEDETAL